MPTYDADGNLISDGKWGYTWNCENRLIALESLSLTNGALRLEFAYDFEGRRLSKKVYAYNGSSFELQTSNSFLYDGWNLIHERLTNNILQITETKSFTWGLDLSLTSQGAGGVGGLLAQITDNGSTNGYFVASDANGNITDYVDKSGSIVARYAYDAFGCVVSQSGSLAGAFNYRFSSTCQDLETGLNYYGFRYYDANMGRWLNRDPINEDGGVNLFQFVLNSPINLYDVLGTTSGVVQEIIVICPDAEPDTIYFDFWYVTGINRCTGFCVYWDFIGMIDFDRPATSCWVGPTDCMWA